jgi:hypothetical protein
MEPLEIHLDHGFGEKSLVISPLRIGEGDGLGELLRMYDPGIIVFAANGDLPPPFPKGSSVLRELRTRYGKQFTDWKRVVPLTEDPESLIQVLRGYPVPAEAAHRESWGIWFCRAEETGGGPDLVAINFPVWLLRNQWKDEGMNPDSLVLGLSILYRAVVAGLDLVRTFNSQPLATVLMSDIGGTMLRGSSLSEVVQPMRIRVMGEVLGTWLANSIQPSKVVVAFGGTVDDGLVSRAWSEQVQQGQSEEQEFGEALRIRETNADLCRRIAYLPSLSKPGGLRLSEVLGEAATRFESSPPSLVTELMQSRSLAEVLVVFHLQSRSGRKLPHQLEDKIDSLRDFGVSSWVVQYLHTIRALGNEAAHIRLNTTRRPEKPVGRDLVVLHAALNRVLVFALGEFA